MKNLTLLLIGGSILAWFLFYNSTINTLDTITESKTLTANIIQEISDKELNITAPQQKIEQSNFIKQCDEELEQHKPLDKATEQEFLASLEHSGIPEKQLAYILFSQHKNSRSKRKALALFNRNYPDNPLVLFDLIGLCSDNTSGQDCNLTLLEQAINLDNNNGSLWLQIANYHAARDNETATIFAIQQVITATYFINFDAKSTELYLNASAGSNIEQFSDRAINALGYSAARTWYVDKIINFCRQGPIADENKDLLCWQLGKALKQRSNTSLIRAIGSALQQSVANIDHQMPPPINRQHIVLNELQLQAQNLALFDQQLFREYLININLYGEKEAIQHLVKLAILKSKSPNYYPCSS